MWTLAIENYTEENYSPRELLVFLYHSLSGAPAVRVITSNEAFTRATSQGGSTLRSRKYLQALLLMNPTYVTGGRRTPWVIVTR